MYRSQKIAIIIPCLNEENFIQDTLKGIPTFADKIYVINDGSTDATQKIITSYRKKDKRIILIGNSINMGNGYSVTKGYKQAIQDNMDIACIVAGDNQCRIEYLENLIEKVVLHECDYAKANRFYHAKELNSMPHFRKFGNVAMSLVSKFASGYYSITDPLNSYSALSASTLKRMELDSISHRYDFENSLLFHLYMVGAKIKDVPVPARYDGEISDIKLKTYLPTVTKTIIKTYIKRVYYKYILFTFHPIAIFLIAGFILLLFGIGYGLKIMFEGSRGFISTPATVMLSVVPFITGFQLILNAIVLDIQNEPK